MRMMMDMILPILKMVGCRVDGSDEGDCVRVKERGIKNDIK